MRTKPEPAKIFPASPADEVHEERFFFSLTHDTNHKNRQLIATESDLNYDIVEGKTLNRKLEALTKFGKFYQRCEKYLKDSFSGYRCDEIHQRYKL